MKKALILLLFFISFVGYSASTWTSTGLGSTALGYFVWTDATNWTCSGACGSSFPPSSLSTSDVVNVNHSTIRTSLTMKDGGATINIAAGEELRLNGDLNTDGFAVQTIAGAGTLDVRDDIIIINGPGFSIATDVTMDNFDANAGFVGGTFTGSTTVLSDINIGSGSTYNFEALTVMGSVVVTNNATFNVNGVANITGNLTSGGSGGLKANFATTTTIGGTITGANSAAFTFGGTTTSGNVSLVGSSSITGSGSLDFTGVPALSGGGNICGNSVGATVPDAVDLSTCNMVLPITLSYFNAQIKDGVFVFNWQTVLEENNDYFNLEYSNDGVRYVSFATIDGAGNSFETLDYEYFASNVDVALDVVYFRLKQTDFDGQFSYSYIVPVSMSGQSLASLFYLVPNPVQDAGELRLLQFDPEAIYNAEILNALTMSSERTFVVENGTASIDFSSLESGVYFIKIEGFLDAVKIIVE